MAASWIINLLLGFIALLFTFFSSLTNNTWQTSLYRAIFGFFLFFLIGYLVRWTSKKAVNVSQPLETEQREQVQQQRMEETDEVPVEEPSFQAIPLHSLHMGESAEDLNNITNTVRKWTSENQEG